MTSAHIVIADDHPLFIFAMQEKIKRIWPEVIFASASNYQQLFRILEQQEASLDLLILDLAMPGCEGMQGVDYITEHYASLPVIVVSGHDDFASRQHCLAQGVVDFISKTEADSVLLKLISQSVFADMKNINSINQDAPETDLFPSLTASQQKVLVLMADGLSNKAIARKLDVSEKTVRVHASAIFKQLGVENRTQAAIKYKQFGTLHADS
ncbi:response regulator transcription factor [Thalassotalea mangrovi]|uniref:Response regulator transcription factor n=1 Tax=Thalassotalea mangrovi TaxID=2572245 RepID=A0A4U1BCB7_9GAMM|nr:response regulator transcription factor [Thalassotalea mangrovi]TKB47834.1 response regulator transcription factor [Thalassotalea mangrovi]